MPRYLKLDSELGYIDNSVEIEYAKFNNLRHSVIGVMLGDFNENGEYIISKEIVNELVLMRKFISDSVDNIEICHGEFVVENPFIFAITYEGNRATLSILEKINLEANFKLNSGAYSNIKETILDQVETSGEINRNLLYKKWNIGEFGGQEISIFSCDEEMLTKYFGIVERYKYLMLANIELLEKEKQLENLEINYTNSTFECLERYPELQKLVVEQLNNTIKEKNNFLDPKKANFAKTFNELLDNAISSNLTKLNQEDQSRFKAEQQNNIQQINIGREQIEPFIKSGEQNLIRLQINLLYRTLTDIRNLYLQKLKENNNRKMPTNPYSAKVNSKIQIQTLYVVMSETNMISTAESNLITATTKKVVNANKISNDKKAGNVKKANKTSKAVNQGQASKKKDDNNSKVESNLVVGQNFSSTVKYRWLAGARDKLSNKKDGNLNNSEKNQMLNREQMAKYMNGNKNNLGKSQMLNREQMAEYINANENYLGPNL